MVKIFYDGGYTIQQMAYARRIFGAKNRNKKYAALEAGYSPHVAETAKSKIESTQGFKNAMFVLANESDNMAMAVMAEFKARGLKDFTNKDLISALKEISNAWSKFKTEERREEEKISPNGSRLRTLVLQQIENQHVTNNEIPQVTKVQPDVDLDF